MLAVLVTCFAVVGCAGQDEPSPQAARAAAAEDDAPVAFGLDVEGAVAQWEHCSCNLKEGRCALAVEDSVARTLEAAETTDVAACRAHCIETGRDAGVRCGRPVKI